MAGTAGRPQEASVIVCICQRLSDRKIRESISGGARTAGAVFRAAGCAPRCGSCLPIVKTMVAEGSRDSAPFCPEMAVAAAE
jgi:bacterioferritin-associated ferredoxin